MIIKNIKILTIPGKSPDLGISLETSQGLILTSAIAKNFKSQLEFANAIKDALELQTKKGE